MSKTASIPIFVLTALCCSCTPPTPTPTPTQTTWYQDNDDDNYGDPATEFVGDQPDASWIATAGDCDDSSATINPDATETADLVDQDCDGTVDNGFKYVFVTSAVYDGNLGGLAGADAKCQAQSSSVGSIVPSGTYKAWIATGDGDAPVDLHNHSTDSYVRPDGVTVAYAWGDLIDAQIVNPINTDQTGILVQEYGRPDGNVMVWTNVQFDGDYNQPQAGEAGPFYDQCSGFIHNNNSDAAITGSSTWTTSDWTDASVANCSDTAHLYCFQQ